MLFISNINGAYPAIGFGPDDAHSRLAEAERIVNRLGLEEFPDTVARSLSSVTFLNLDKNDFTHLPVAMSSLTSLSFLSMNHNGVQSDRRSYDMLASMSKLFCISLVQDDIGEPIWSPESAAVMILIAKERPDLHVEVLFDVRRGRGGMLSD